MKTNSTKHHGKIMNPGTPSSGTLGKPRNLSDPPCNHL